MKRNKKERKVERVLEGEEETVSVPRADGVTGGSAVATLRFVLVF